MRGRPGFPLQAAALDVGSNAIRYAAAEFHGPSEYRVTQEERLPVRLGERVFQTGRLAEEVMDRAVAGLRTLRERLAAAGIGHYRAVATSAVREAANAEEFLRRVREEASLRLDVITGVEEARLVHVAVRSRVPLQGGGRRLLVDLGGGSLEVSMVDEQGIHWSESHKLGAVRLLEEIGSCGEVQSARSLQLLEEYAATLRLRPIGGAGSVAGLIATGGSIETLAALAGAPRDERGTVIVSEEVLPSLIETLSRLSYRERIEQLKLREDRADVILPAAVVYRHLAALAGVREILVPHVGLKEGLLLDLVDSLTRHGSHADLPER